MPDPLEVTMGSGDYRKSNNPKRQPFCTLNRMRAGGDLALDDGTCCDIDADRAIFANFQDDMALTSFTNTSNCYSYHASIMCSECHPFAGHLYEGDPVNLALGGVLLTNSSFLQKWKNACNEAPALVSKYYVNPGTTGRYKQLKGVPGSADSGAFAFPFDPVWYWGTGGSGTPPNAAFTSLPGPDHVMQMRMRPDVNYWWLVNKHGYLYEFENVPTVSSKSLVLDITDKVLESNSEGMLDISFDPLFETNKVFYVFYCYNHTETNNYNPQFNIGDHYARLARFILMGTPEATKATEISVMDVYQTSYLHKAGAMEWHNGELYLMIGDGGGNNDQYNSAQNMATLLGKLLRLTINPSTGAYTGTGFGGVDNLVMAIGIRNPHKMSIDSATNELWWGEVGQAQREEVNMLKLDITTMQNMGWPYWEGKRCNLEAFNVEGGNSDCTDLPYSVTTPPLYDYCHEMNKPTTPADMGECPANYTGSCAIGGYVYRGSKYPNLYGHYVYVDYRNSEASVLLLNRTGGQTTLFAKKHLQPLGINVASLAIDKDGEVYYVSHKDLGSLPVSIMPISNCGELCDPAATATPTMSPTAAPSIETTAAPSHEPTQSPTMAPTVAPTGTPTEPPGVPVTPAPTKKPHSPKPNTLKPTRFPTTSKPTRVPTTSKPTRVPTGSPMTA